jgi:hypothetical protein
MSFTVTATVTGGASDGNLFVLKVAVLTGAAASQPGTTVTVTAAGSALNPPQRAITPSATGSYVYGALVTYNGGGAGYTANADTTLATATTHTGNTCYSAFRSSAQTTAATPVTLGASAPATGMVAGALAMAEILASGTLAEDATTPAGVQGTGQALTTAAFTPPAGALLIAASAAAGPTSNPPYAITITDTSGLGLTWTALAAKAVPGQDACGVWATMQSPAATLSLAGGSYQTFI